MEVDEAMVDTILVVLVVVCIFWVESMQFVNSFHVHTKVAYPWNTQLSLHLVE